MMEYQVFLRPLRFEDWEVTLRWHRNPDIWKWTANDPSKYNPTPESEQVWIRKALEDSASRRYVICLNGSEEPVGIVGIHHIDFEARTAGTFIFIGDTASFGKGYGYQALRQCADLAFTELELTNIEAWVSEENKASVAVHQKAGYHFTDQYNQTQVMMRRMVLQIQK